MRKSEAMADLITRSEPAPIPTASMRTDPELRGPRGDDAAIRSFSARLILLLANHVGDRAVLSRALAEAARKPAHAAGDPAAGGMTPRPPCLLSTTLLNTRTIHAQRMSLKSKRPVPGRRPGKQAFRREYFMNILRRTLLASTAAALVGLGGTAGPRYPSRNRRAAGRGPGIHLSRAR